jgi:hypothetical protein
VTDKLYLQYAELFSDISITELELNEKRRHLEEVKEEIAKDNDGSFGLDLTAHAFTNITDRLSSLASEYSVVYSDVFNPQNPSKAILWPNNLRSFIIGMLANERAKNKQTEKPSKNTNGGTEYHYDIEIKKWSNDRSSLIFTAIVESNMVKTGYFNWTDRRR